MAAAAPHDLRRSCVTNRARALPMHVTRELAGHGKIETTERYYLAVTRDDMESVRQAQNRVVEGIEIGAAEAK